MYGRLRVNVKVERGSSFTFTRDLPYFAFIFLRVYNVRAFARKNFAIVKIHLNAIYLINLYPVDSATGLPNTYAG